MSVQLTSPDLQEQPTGIGVIPKALRLYMKQSNGCGRLIMYIVGGAAVVVALGFLTSFLGGDEFFSGSFFAVLILGAVVGLAVWMGSALWWYYKVTALMDLPTVFADTTQLRRDKDITITYKQHFKKDAEIEALQLQLICQEWVRYTEGTSTYTDTRDIVMDEDWRGHVPVSAAQDYEETLTLRVPTDAMHTWTEGRNNRIEWKIKLVLDMPGNRDFQDAYDVQVVPEVSNA